MSYNHDGYIRYPYHQSPMALISNDQGKHSDIKFTLHCLMSLYTVGNFFFILRTQHNYIILSKFFLKLPSLLSNKILFNLIFQRAKDSLTTRVFNYTGEFQPVKWTCRAPLPSGKLCSRMDRYKVNLSALICSPFFFIAEADIFHNGVCIILQILESIKYKIQMKQTYGLLSRFFFFFFFFFGGGGGEFVSRRKTSN